MENIRQSYINKVINAVARESKGVTYVPNKQQVVDSFALTSDELYRLFEVEGEILEQFKGIKFDTEDYVFSGGYQFTFTIKHVIKEEWETLHSIREVVWTLQVEVNLDGSSVTLFTTGEEMELGEAVDDSNIGYEIEGEIKELIRDIVRAESPILKGLGADIKVDLQYIV